MGNGSTGLILPHAKIYCKLIVPCKNPAFFSKK
jgi:hypothetical protein